MVILALIVLSFFAFNPDNVLPGLSAITATNLQQILILLGLTGLPGVLIWSSKQVRKLKNVSSEIEKLARYTVILYVRLVVYTLIGLYTLVVQYLTHMNGALMFMMIVFVLFVFVWPTKARFEAELSDDKHTTNDDETHEPSGE